ncbi:hypothetical protein [Embleya sp. NPDC059237]|uniref:hypothetical protein n=1 Tax=Embleya sp. NPDC059237 TaxID=3346784 RepID=UPI0036770204
MRAQELVWRRLTDETCETTAKGELWHLRVFGSREAAWHLVRCSGGLPGQASRPLGARLTDAQRIAEWMIAFPARAARLTVPEIGLAGGLSIADDTPEFVEVTDPAGKAVVIAHRSLAPGLIIHPTPGVDPRLPWTISHEGEMRGIARAIKVGAVRKAAGALASAADWTRPLFEIEQVPGLRGRMLGTLVAHGCFGFPAEGHA